MSWFASEAMAQGYALARPALHERILAAALDRRYENGLDLGCGAGLSTRALRGWVARAWGVDPIERMVRAARGIAPDAGFLAAAMEALPLGDASVDLATAAGSLNYAQVDVALAETARVLRRGGALVVYDFSTGRSFSGSAALDEWFAGFVEKYPWPSGDGRVELSPQALEERGGALHFEAGAEGEWQLPMSAERYLNYVMSETNVAAALAGGESEGAIRDCCRRGLEEAFGGAEREVVFRGYWSRLRSN